MPIEVYAFAQGPNGPILLLAGQRFHRKTLPWLFARADCLEKGSDPATVFFVERLDAIRTPALRVVLDAYEVAFHDWVIAHFGLSEYCS